MQIGITKDRTVELYDSSKEYDIVLDEQTINTIYKIYTKYPICKIVINKTELETVVSELLNITPASIHIKTRKRDVVYARHIIFFIFFITHYGTLSRIGEMYLKDHATVIHSVEQCTKALDGYNPDLYIPLKKTLIYFNLWDKENNKPKVFPSEDVICEYK